MPRQPVAPHRGPCGTREALFRTRMSTVPKKSDGRQRARNRFTAQCCICGQQVQAGAGCIEKSDAGWDVFC